MKIYKKVSIDDIREETDLVITLITGPNGPFAFITDPSEACDSIPMPVEDALSIADDILEGEDKTRNLVIVDDEDLWDRRWGKLVTQPDPIAGATNLTGAHRSAGHGNHLFSTKFIE